MIMMIVKKRLIYQNNIKEWLANHPNRNNPKSPLFVSLDNHSNGRKQLTRHGLYDMYRYYQKRLYFKIWHHQKDKKVKFIKQVN
jgi:hypothetical protein